MMQLKLVLNEEGQLSANKIEEIRFNSWSSFKASFLDNLPNAMQYDTEDDRYIYRGHGCSTWDLTSSFDRLHNEKNLKNREDLFNEHLSCFQKESIKSGYITQDNIINSVAAKAQHYGMPTRLLDWTYSPYIAAYFAYSSMTLLEKHGNRDVSIWVMDKASIEATVYEKHLDIVELIEDGNHRLNAQYGLFTRLYTSHSSVNTMIADEYTKLSTSLIKFSLPSTEVENVLRDLSLMGISSKSLFPGIEGVARYATIKSMLKNAND